MMYYLKKRDFMHDVNLAARSYNTLIKQVEISMIESVQNVLIANSEGLFIEDRRVRGSNM